MGFESDRLVSLTDNIIYGRYD